jgi:hypothetical protein
MNKLSLILVISCFYFSILYGQNHDTIVFSVNKIQYEKVAKEELKRVLANSQSSIYGKYTENQLKTFSIPTFEWNQKAHKFTCESHEKLENLLSFRENPYFQIILLIDNESNNVSNFFCLAISLIRMEQRIKDSIDWVSQIPNIPYSHFSSNPFPYCDLKRLNKAYKYHLKHPDTFIFRISDYEDFWVIKDYQLYRLGRNCLENANQYLYTCGEEYIQDIANGNFRTGYPYIGCFNKDESLYWSKQGNRIFVKVKYEIQNTGTE